jgi:GNAT superfamily N-acetyltransferase
MLTKQRNSFHTKNFSLIQIDNIDHFCCNEIKCFNCGDNDLNDFFQNDAKNYKKHLLAETYYLQPKKAAEFFPVAFASFLNDSIGITQEERKSEKKQFGKFIKKTIPYPKNTYGSFPAVKIGRLGVVTEYQNKHIGTYMLNMIKAFFKTENRTGCRFITVDSYKTSTDFYKKNGFDFLWDGDSDKQTRIMFFDLISHIVNK